MEDLQDSHNMASVISKSSWITHSSVHPCYIPCLARLIFIFWVNLGRVYVFLIVCHKMNMFTDQGDNRNNK